MGVRFQFKEATGRQPANWTLTPIKKARALAVALVLLGCVLVLFGLAVGSTGLESLRPLWSGDGADAAMAR
ncbi:MAG TPA: hypothetical protein PLL92_14905, partial [Alicycliphilus sp.]|nr:hypothetical protein [Alicycliphilus sp.]